MVSGAARREPPAGWCRHPLVGVNSVVTCPVFAYVAKTSGLRSRHLRAETEIFSCCTRQFSLVPMLLLRAFFLVAAHASVSDDCTILRCSVSRRLFQASISLSHHALLTPLPTVCLGPYVAPPPVVGTTCIRHRWQPRAFCLKP